ncbi:MAG: AAA family ATPase [Solirubrobacteraceae bacterium]
MGRVIAVASQKGGVGKTTTVRELAAVWGASGRRVLAVDFDPQFALTRGLGCAPSAAPGTADQVVLAQRDVGDAIVTEAIPGVDLLAGHRNLASVELTLVPQMSRETFLADALSDAIGAYDMVLIDCPPNLGLLTVNALYAANEVLVPVDMTAEGALHGAAEVLATVAQIARRRTIAVRGLVRTRVDIRSIAYQRINPTVFTLGAKVVATQIPERRAFANATLEGRPLAVSAPAHAGSVAYRRLAGELDESSAPRKVA